MTNEIRDLCSNGKDRGCSSLNETWNVCLTLGGKFIRPRERNQTANASSTGTIKSSARSPRSPVEGTPTDSRSSCFFAPAHLESLAARHRRSRHRTDHAAGCLHRSTSRHCSIVLLTIHQARGPRLKRPIYLPQNTLMRHSKGLDEYRASCS